VIGGLGYPKHLLSLALLLSSRHEMSSIAEQWHGRLKKQYRSVTFVYRELGGLSVGRDDSQRHDAQVQKERRSLLARYRNLLLSHALVDEEFALWIDADITMVPERLIQTFLMTSKDIVTPQCLRDGHNYDKNTWVGPRVKPNEADRKRIATGGLFVPRPVPGITKFIDDFQEPLVRLDSVGGTVLWVRSDLHRQGLVFPPIYIIGSEWEHDGYDGIETEGICYIAKRMGAECYGMPLVTTRHDSS